MALYRKPTETEINKSAGSIEFDPFRAPPSNPNFGDVWVASIPHCWGTNILYARWDVKLPYPMVCVPSLDRTKKVWVGVYHIHNPRRYALYLDLASVPYYLNFLSVRHGLSPLMRESYLGGPDNAVIAPDYSSVTNPGFRPPTLEEWKHFANADSNYSYAGSNNPKEVMWTPGAHSRIFRVGALKPNAWGLHDMQGGCGTTILDPVRGFASVSLPSLPHTPISDEEIDDKFSYVGVRLVCG